jgi:CubicO group peptidase (beta-lactamase class C family)
MVAADELDGSHGPDGLHGLDGLDGLVGSLLAEGVAPACALGWARAGVTGETGESSETGGARDLLFDLASLTKPMTAVALGRSGLDRRAPLGELLEEARGTPSEGVPLELFLAHRAGLDAHRSLYAPLVTGGRVDVAAALREAAEARRPGLTAAAAGAGELPSEGFDPLYSDLGYVLVGVALARATGARDAGEAIERLVLAPLGLQTTAGTVRGLAERGILGPFAPTETVEWRGGPVVGAVHDENAWALTGLGGSGHAGIFGTIGAVLTFGVRVMVELADDPSLAWLVRERPGGSLRAGFDGKSPPPAPSSAGTWAGPRTFGHLGFTGTSLWIDPDAGDGADAGGGRGGGGGHAGGRGGVAVALLTNRVCPTREHLAIREARPRVHDALFARAARAASFPVAPGPGGP